MADTFSIADPDRNDRYDTAAAAMVAVSSDVRAQIAKKLTNGVPDRARTLFRASWWDQAVDRNATPVFAGIAVDTIDDFADGLDLNLDFDQRADVGGRTVGAVVGLLGSRFDTVRSRVRDLHAQALKEGWDADRLADELGLDGDSPGVLSDDVSAGIGGSLATFLMEAAGVYSLTAADVTATKTWRSMGDERVREAHADADGQTVGIDETFDVGGYQAMFPGDPDLPADLAINCVPEGTRVSGFCTAAMRSWYSGDLIDVTTARGKTLSATPDHHVLTGSGWVRIGRLQPGDQLLGAGESDAATGTGHDPADGQPAIEEAFRAAQAAAVRGERAGSLVMHLDGDVAYRKVEVQRPDLPFPVGLYAKQLEQLGKVTVPVSHGEVSLADHPSAEFRVRHPDQRGLVPGANRQTEVVQARLHDAAPDAQLPGDLLDRDVALVHAGDVIEISGSPVLGGSQRLPSGVEQARGDHRLADVQVPGDVGDAAAPVVPLDDTVDVRGALLGVMAELAPFRWDPVISVTKRPYIGHVYDITTPAGLYCAADFVIHNCRCALEYSVEPDTGDGIDTTDLEEEVAMAATGQLGRHVPVPVPRPTLTMLAAYVKAFAVDGSRVTVTVEPTAAEKQALAAVADVPAQLHVPLLDVTDVASLTPDARVALAGALSTVAANTPPLSGTIAGTGYLETDGVTVGIVECPGLGALRDQIAAALVDMVPEPGEFIPAVVLTSGSIDATQIAGVPVHFNELRVHVGGTETLVFDLLGPLPTAPSPDTAAPTPETPPAPADNPPAETPPAEAPPMTSSTVATYSSTSGNLPAGWRLVPATATTSGGIVFQDMPGAAPGDMPQNAPPAPALADATDEDIEAEIARRAAAQAAADTGGDPEDLMAEALAEVSGIVAEVVAELESEDPAEATAVPDAPMPAYSTDTMAAGGEAGLPLADRDTTWDAAAADGRVSKMASSDGSGDPDTIDWAAYGRAFFWHAPNPSTKADFKLGFADVVNGQLQAVPKGVFAVAGALQGSRGGVDIPDTDKETVRGKVSSYYAAMRSKWNDDSITPPWDTAVDSPATLAGELAPDVNADGIGEGPAVDYDWEGILAIEGVATSDGRMFAEGALTWRTLPLTLALQTVTAPGHDGAVVCGSICEIERVGNTIVGRGRFSGTEAGELARTLIGEGSLHGVSIDVASAIVVYTDDSGDEIDEMDAMLGVPAVAVFVEAEMMAATLTPFPAFADARVDLLDVPTSLVATGAPGRWRLSGPALFTLNSDTEALVASAAPTIPAPPASLFALKPDTREPFSVRAPLPDGTIPVYGLLADWNIPHIGHDGRKVYPPRGDDFAMFYTGKFVRTREGDRIPTGPIFIDTVHPNLAAQASDAQAFYAHTGAAVADVHLYNGEHGIVAAGVLRRDVDELTRCRMEGSDVSPDWRPVNGQYRMIAILAVNASGFPVPYIEGIAASAGRLRSWVAYDDTTGEPLAMVAVGAVHRVRKPGEVVADLQATVAAQATQLASLESKVQLLSAATFAATEPPAPEVAVPVAADDDGPVELSADERAARARAAMAALGLDRESRRRRALTAMGITD